MRSSVNQGEGDGVQEGQEEEEQGLVPKLRFPEFRDAGEWEDKKLFEVW